MIAALQRGSAGYRLAVRIRNGSPWPWLPAAHPELVGPRRDRMVFSTLRNLDPTIELYVRTEPPPARP